MRQTAGRERNRAPSAQCNFIGRQKPREIVAGKKSMLPFSLMGQRVEFDQGVVDKSGMAHHQALVRQAIEKSTQQSAEVGSAGKVIGAGERRIEGKAVPRGVTAKSRAERIEQHGFWRADPPGRLRSASALAHPGVRRGGLDRRQESLAYLGKQLDVLMAIDVIRNAAEQR